MKPGNQIILLWPDEPKSGPTKEWVQQFANNLKFTSDRCNAGVAEVKILTPGEKDARQLLKAGNTIIVIFHASWLGDGTYSKLIENEIMGGADSDRRLMLISVSPGYRHALNGKLEKLPSFSFYDPQPIEPGSGLIDESLPAYWSKLLDLILDLGQSPLAASSVIYLAQTESDITSSRDIIRRELIEHGYRVVPDIDLLSHQKDLKSYIQRNLDKSRLAIHLLGNSYGDVLENTSFSISESQVHFIGEYLETIEMDKTLSTRSPISRLIWVDPEFTPSDKKQADFVEELKRNIEKL